MMGNGSNGRSAPFPVREKPACVPAGVPHTVFTFEEAVTAFLAAGEAVDPRVCERLRLDAVANLAHSWLVAVTKREPVDEQTAARLFRELTAAAGVWR